MFKKIRDLYFSIPLVGEIFLEYRGRSRASPYFIMEKEADEYLFCIGSFCGIFDPLHKPNKQESPTKQVIHQVFLSSCLIQASFAYCFLK